MSKQIITKTINKTIDVETGEIVDETRELTMKSISVKVAKEDFFILYANSLMLLSDCIKPTGTFSTFLWIIDNYQGVYGDIAINKSVKTNIANRYNLSLSAVEKALVELCNKSLLIKSGRGTYKVNPLYVWKGSLKDRQKLLNINIQSD